MTRKTLLTIILGCAGVLVMACACMTLVGSGLLWSGYQNVAREILEPDINVAVEPLPSSGEPQDLQGQMDEIERQVVAIRGWSLDAPLPRNLQTSEALREEIIADFDEDYSTEEADDDATVYYALGLLPAEFDLYNMYIDLYSGSILGYYEPEDDAIYVISDDPELNSVGLSTYAHEYQHALQDAYHGIRELGYSDEGFEEDSQRALAIQALIEGEASFVEAIWQLTYFDQSDYNEYLWVSLQYEFGGAIPEGLPDWMLDDLQFPYQYGLEFVDSLYQEGGWAAVDAAYENPPVSVEMIIHPDRYRSGDMPVVLDPIDLGGVLGAEWHEVDSDVLGEWFLTLVLREHLTSPDADFSENEAARARAARAAAGWGGDTYTVYANDSNGALAMAVQFVWDTTQDADEFAATFIEYGDNRFGSARSTENGRICWNAGEYHCLYSQGDENLWVLAPDLATVEAIAAEVGGF